MLVTQMTTTQYQSRLLGDMCFNTHSTTFLGGEVRGQICNVIRTAVLSGTHNPATGAASFSVTASLTKTTAAHMRTYSKIELEFSKRRCDVNQMA
jgi:hypothetical protein